jgi:hypothetical protein
VFSGLGCGFFGHESFSLLSKIDAFAGANHPVSLSIEGRLPKFLAFVFDDYAGNIQRNSGKNVGFLDKFQEFRGLKPGFACFFLDWARLRRVSSDGNSLPPRLETHEESTRRRDHGDHEAHPRVGFSSA